MPGPIKREKEYNHLYEKTNNFLQLYTEKHAAIRYFAAYRENPSRIQAASLIEKFSKHTKEEYQHLGAYDIAYLGQNNREKRYEFISKVLKGILVLNLLTLKANFKGAGMFTYPLEETCLYPLLLEALGVKSFEEIPTRKINDSLDRLDEYLKLMLSKGKWEEAEATRIIGNIKTIRTTVEVQQAAAAAGSPVTP